MSLQHNMIADWCYIWHWLKKIVFFTIQLIFAIIHESHCTFWYYSWIPLYYFSQFLALSTVLSIKSFQFQLNKFFPNGLWVYKHMQNWCFEGHKRKRERERERERQSEREREFTVDEIKKKEKDETKQEKQVKKERGEIKMINHMDVKKVAKKKKKKKRKERSRKLGMCERE